MEVVMKFIFLCIITFFIISHITLYRSDLNWIIPVLGNIMAIALTLIVTYFAPVYFLKKMGFKDHWKKD